MTSGHLEIYTTLTDVTFGGLRTGRLGGQFSA